MWKLKYDNRAGKEVTLHSQENLNCVHKSVKSPIAIPVTDNTIAQNLKETKLHAQFVDTCKYITGHEDQSDQSSV